MFRAATSVLLANLFLTGCHCSGNSTAEKGSDGVVVLVESEIGTLDPRFAASSYEIKVSRMVFSGLTTADTQDLSTDLLMASSVQPQDDDGRVWLVTLRDDARFHDGRPVTSRDVVYTYGSIADPDVGSRYRATYSYIRKVEAVDERTVRFTLDEPSASFLPDLTFPILPAHVLAPAGGKLDEDSMVGSGPFRLVSRTQGQVELARWPQPEAGSGDVRHVIIKTVRDDNARVLWLQGGGADLAQNNIPVHLLTLFEKGETRIVSEPGAAFTYLGLNLQSPPLDDPRVREALLCALDRKSIIEHKLGGLALPSTGMLPPRHWAHTDRAAAYPYDRSKAMRLLDEAGYPDPDGDGPDTRFTLVFKTSSNRFRVAVARVIVAQLADVGVDVDLRPFEFSTLRSHLDSGAFQMTFLEIPMVLEPNLYRWFFHSSSIPGRDRGGANRWRYRSEEADALIEKGVAVTDMDERRQVYEKLQVLLSKDLPVLPLWHPHAVAVTSTRLTDYRLLPSAPFTPLAHAHLKR